MYCHSLLHLPLRQRPIDKNERNPGRSTGAAVVQDPGLVTDPWTIKREPAHKDPPARISTMVSVAITNIVLI
jgi:hypothetical protein